MHIIIFILFSLNSSLAFSGALSHEATAAFERSHDLIIEEVHDIEERVRNNQPKPIKIPKFPLNLPTPTSVYERDGQNFIKCANHSDTQDQINCVDALLNKGLDFNNALYNTQNLLGYLLALNLTTPFKALLVHLFKKPHLISESSLFYLISYPNQLIDYLKYHPESLKSKLWYDLQYYQKFKNMSFGEFIISFGEKEVKEYLVSNQLFYLKPGLKYLNFDFENDSEAFTSCFSKEFSNQDKKVCLDAFAKQGRNLLNNISDYNLLMRALYNNLEIAEHLTTIEPRLVTPAALLLMSIKSPQMLLNYLKQNPEILLTKDLSPFFEYNPQKKQKVQSLGEHLVKTTREVVEFVLSNKMFMKTYGKNINTYQSISTRQFENIDLFIKYIPGFRTEWDIQPLMEALLKNDLTPFQRLIQQDSHTFRTHAQTIHPKFKMSLFHFACSLGKMGVITLMLKSGVDENSLDAKGNSCLFMAAQKGNYDLVNFLLRGQVKNATSIQYPPSFKRISLNQEKLDEYVRFTDSKGKLTYFDDWARNKLNIKESEGIKFYFDQVKLKLDDKNSHLNFRGANFRNCILEGNFAKQFDEFYGVFDNCTIRSSSFQWNMAHRMEFVNSHLYMVSFLHSNIDELEFINTDVYYSDFSQTKIKNLTVKDSIFLGNQFIASSVNKLSAQNLVSYCNVISEPQSFHLQEQEKCRSKFIGTLTHHYFANHAGEGIGMNEDSLVQQILIHGMIPVPFAFDELGPLDDLLKEEVQGFVNNQEFMAKQKKYISFVQAMMGEAEKSPSHKGFQELRELIQVYVKTVQAFMLPGGADIFPLIYGDKPGKNSDYEDDETWSDFKDTRFLVESQVIQETSELDKPLYGVCRGNQAVNIYFGGQLFSHVEGQNGVTQEIKILKNSGWVGKIISDSVIGESNHHQGVKVTGKGIEVVATITNQDGIVIPKILQGTNDSFPLFLFQFHPENDINDGNAKYMSAFFQEAKDYPKHVKPGICSPLETMSMTCPR